MLKTAALILLSATLGMGGAVALTLSHGVQQDRQQDRLATRQASPKPLSDPSLRPQPAVAAAQAAPQSLPAAPSAAEANQPALPRLLPRPRPAMPEAVPAETMPTETMPATVAAAELPRLTISSQSATQPFAFAAPSAGPLPATVAEVDPAALPPPLAPRLLNAEGRINYNPWKTGVYR